MVSRKIRLTAILLSLVMALSLLSACGNKEEAPKEEPEAQEEEQTEEEQGEEAEEESNTSGVATAEDMTTVEEVVEEGMVPVTADQLVDGNYEVVMKSSSSMFKALSTELQVADGKMQVVLTMKSEAYKYMFPDAAEKAAEAKEEDLIPLTEDHTFTLPIDALDAPVTCAAFSAKKELWYDRTLLFRADSLPLTAFREGVIVTPASLDVEDGEYTVEVGFAGGTGKTTVTSPTKIVFAGDSCTATIEFSSPNYDYMLVNGEKYLPVNTEGNSTFEIPVSHFDRPMAITADTTAMSTPHEIDYTLTFDSASLKPAE